MAGPELHDTSANPDERYPPVIRRRRLALCVSAVVAVALFLGGQAAAGIGAENRCVHRSDSSRYRWHQLEWRWAAVPPGVWCTWTDTATGEVVGAWAWGPMPDEHLAPQP